MTYSTAGLGNKVCSRVFAFMMPYDSNSNTFATTCSESLEGNICVFLKTWLPYLVKLTNIVWMISWGP